MNRSRFAIIGDLTPWGLVACLWWDATSYLQGNLGLKPWSSRYQWWRKTKTLR